MKTATARSSPGPPLVAVRGTFGEGNTGDDVMLLATVAGVWENHADLRRQIAACHAFIGVRFHSVLLAVQEGDPVLAISYAEKTANFMTENGLGRFVIRYEDVTAEGLLERWRRLWR